MGCLDANPTTGWNWEGGKDGHAPACAKKSAIEEERDGAGPAIWGDAAPLKGTNAVPLYNSTGPNCTGKPGMDGCNSDIAEQPVKLETLNSRYRDEAIKFVNAHAVTAATTAASSNPFFLYMPFAHMHVPHGFPDEFKNTSTRKTIYGDTLRE